jgi:hypothetical protein
MDAIRGDLDPDDEYVEIENALPGCILDLRSSLLRAATTRRKCVVEFDFINVDMHAVHHDAASAAVGPSKAVWEREEV